MARVPISIDSELEGFIHSAFRMVIPIYPGKAAPRKKVSDKSSLSIFGEDQISKKLVMTGPFQYQLAECQTIQPCLLILSTPGKAVQCLPGRTCDFRNGIETGVVYQVGIEGAFFSSGFKRTATQLLTTDDNAALAEPDFSFLHKLQNAFPALAKEVKKLEEERRVWKVEQQDDPNYLKSVDKAIKRVLDKLFLVGKDSTEKKGVYQSGITNLLNIQKVYKARLESITVSSAPNPDQDFRLLAALIRAIHIRKTDINSVITLSEANSEIGRELKLAFTNYYKMISQAEISLSNPETVAHPPSLIDESFLDSFIHQWKNLTFT